MVADKWEHYNDTGMNCVPIKGKCDGRGTCATGSQQSYLFNEKYKYVWQYTDSNVRRALVLQHCEFWICGEITSI